ncbi:MAG: helix-turn-helix domain-containing protein [Anaerolineales bacterium]|jgi:transposase-like protein
MKCPKCESDDKQHKIGKTAAGSQRYRCYLCACKYAPIQKARGYSPEIRQKAVQLYVDGMNLRRIGRHLGVNPQSVANWAKAYAEVLPSAPVPKKVKNAELDELFTFIGDKKPESNS